MPKIETRSGKEINWNQVYLFFRVAASGSIKNAAVELDLSSSTLSEHISQLEEDLHVKLFLRNGRKLTLSPDGLKLFGHAKEMFEIGSRFIDIVSPQELSGYPIAIGISPCNLMNFSIQVISKLTSELIQPDIKIRHAEHSTLMSELLQAHIDFGFSGGEYHHSGIVSKLVREEPLALLCAKSINSTNLKSLLEKHPILALSDNPSFYSSSLKPILDFCDHTPRVISSDYPMNLIELCLQGKGVLLIPPSGISKEIALQLTSINLGNISKALPKSPLFAHWAKASERSFAVQSLIRALKST